VSRIRFEREGPLAWLQLDDGKANAMQLEWLAELNAYYDAIEADPALRVVILIGREGFFSAGLDLKVLPGLSAEELSRSTDTFMETMGRTFLFPKPIVAASTGHAIAGGMMLYLAADLRIALDDDRHRYGLNEATNGIPLLGSTAGICQYSIPRRHHTELILHGRMIDVRQTVEREITDGLAANRAALVALARARAEALLDVEPAAYKINKLILRRKALEEAIAVAASLASESPGVSVFKDLQR